VRSDIDLLLITRRRLSRETKKQLIETLLRISRSPHPLEISFLCLDNLHPWQYPTPFDLHYSEDWRAQYVRDLALDRWQQWTREVKDNDLAAHLTVTKMRGVCLWGEPIDSVFPEVPRADFADSIASDLKWALQRWDRYPVYGVLNACRVCAYFEEGLILSKTEGVEWALAKMPEQFHAVIMSAFKVYRSSEEKIAFSNAEEARQLLGYVAAIISATGQ
jgi:streptomycin 3"-adenylyltransferase